MYSSDAITWTAASASHVATWSRVIFAAGNNKFFAIAPFSSTHSDPNKGYKAMISYDGITWITQGIEGDNQPNRWRGIAYDGNNTYVVVSDNGGNIPVSYTHLTLPTIYSV